MDTATISSIVTLSVAAAPILGTAALFLVGLIVWWRTGSSITILSRLWRLLHGKMSPAVPVISGYLAAQAEVARLSFETGARFRQSSRQNVLSHGPYGMMKACAMPPHVGPTSISNCLG